MHGLTGTGGLDPEERGRQRKLNKSAILSTGREEAESVLR